MKHLHNQREGDIASRVVEGDIASRVEGEIKELKSEVKELKEQIKELADLIRGNGSKMNQHIDFVENVYTSVRHPLNFVKTKIESLIGRTQNGDLPALTLQDSTCPSSSQVDTTEAATA